MYLFFYFLVYYISCDGCVSQDFVLFLLDTITSTSTNVIKYPSCWGNSQSYFYFKFNHTILELCVYTLFCFQFMYISRNFFMFIFCSFCVDTYKILPYIQMYKRFNSKPLAAYLKHFDLFIYYFRQWVIV